MLLVEEEELLRSGEVEESYVTNPSEPVDSVGD